MDDVDEYAPPPTREELMDRFAALEEKWKLEGSVDGFHRILEIFDVSGAADLSPDVVDARFNPDWNAFLTLRGELEQLDVIDNTERGLDILDRFNAFDRTMFYARQCILMFLHATNAQGQYPTPVGLEWRFDYEPLPQEEKDMSPFHYMILYLLGSIYRNRWRRYGDFVYKQIYHNDHPTHSWEEHMEIRDVVKRFCDKEHHFTKWVTLALGKNLEYAAKYLTECCDFEFPDLKMSRRTWSFRDGLYDAEMDRFVPYSNDIDPSIVSCKFINRPFAPAYRADADDPFLTFPRKLEFGEIETPHFDSIMLMQKWSPAMMWWACVFIGRLFYEVNEMDSWQVIPFLKGVAGTGKSTVIKVVEMMYQHRDIGVLGNNVERQFGLSMIADKLLFVAPEIKGEFALDQAQFQSMITGEKVSMAVKGKTAIQTHWTIPGILAGNESVRWADKSGSISRRIVVFPFTVQIPVDKSNPFLLQDIEKNEIPAVIRKCAIAYREAIRLYHRSDVWHVLPKEIQVERDKLQYASNPLFAFLNSEYVHRSPELYCQESQFITVLRAFSKKTFGAGETMWKWNEDFYRSTMDKAGIKIVNEALVWPPDVGQAQSGMYVTGCSLDEKCNAL